MTTATTRKQTAANNATLARIKKEMNAPIFQKASRIWNQSGADAARVYLGQFFNDACRERVLTEFFGETDPRGKEALPYQETRR